MKRDVKGLKGRHLQAKGTALGKEKYNLCIMPKAIAKPDELFMSRCFDIARRGIGSVSPNPPVGSVVVHEGTIIGEGFHQKFGEAHAEVEAIRNVPENKKHLIPHSTLYVSLEPCCTTGKTPPCTDLILREGIKDVRVSVLDPNPDVAGQGKHILQKHGVTVIEGILPEEGHDLIRSFTTNILKRRPHVILKWAQSHDLFIGKEGEQIWLSDPHLKIWSHQLRAESDAILVGARTVMTDDPELTTRAFPGRSPHRVIYDPNGKLHANYKIFNEDGRDIYYFSTNQNKLIPDQEVNAFTFGDDQAHAMFMLETLFEHQIGILLVEGGAYTHQRFIDESVWDEAWWIHTPVILQSGIRAPNVRGKKIFQEKAGRDTIYGLVIDPVYL